MDIAMTIGRRRYSLCAFHPPFSAKWRGHSGSNSFGVASQISDDKPPCFGSPSQVGEGVWIVWPFWTKSCLT